MIEEVKPEGCQGTCTLCSTRHAELEAAIRLLQADKTAYRKCLASSNDAGFDLVQQRKDQQATIERLEQEVTRLATAIQLADEDLYADDRSLRERAQRTLRDALKESLWRARQFIVDNVESGAEFGAIFDIDKTLEGASTNQQQESSSGPLARIAQLEQDKLKLEKELRQEREAKDYYAGEYTGACEAVVGLQAQLIREQEAMRLASRIVCDRQTQVAQLQTTIDRFRTALREIADFWPGDECTEIARAALADD